MWCLKLLLIFAVTGYCIAAPKPVKWDEIGTKLHNLGEKALPAIRTACGVLGSPQYGYPQFQGYYPPVQYYYPQYQGRGYQQASNFPIFPNQNHYPQFGNNFPPNRGVGQPPQFGNNFPPNNGVTQPPQFGNNFPPNRGVGQPPQFGNNFPPNNGVTQPPQFGNNFPPNRGVGQPPQFGNNFPPNNGVEQPKLPRVPPYIPPSEDDVFDSESEEDNEIPDAN